MLGLRFSWLALERAVYVGLALLVLVLRLANLGDHPLSDVEAKQALVAWHIYQGDLVEENSYSPLIVTLNGLGFFLLGGNVFAARLGPALLGVGLVLLPYGLRQHLGREGALATAALFALSPTVAFFSHTLKGQPHNMPMLKRLIERRATLIDYEKVLDDKGRRLVFFGRPPPPPPHWTPPGARSWEP